MRTQVFLISILCLSVCYTSNTNFCVMDAVYHMSESGKRTAMRLSQRSVSGTKQVKVVQTNPTTEVAEVRETLTLVRGSNRLHRWRDASHGSNENFRIPKTDKEEWTLYEKDTPSWTQKQVNSNDEKYEVDVSGGKNSSQRAHPRRPVPHKRRSGHKKKPIHKNKTPIKIGTAWKPYVRKAQACAKNYSKKRMAFITLRKKIERSSRNPSKRTLAQAKSMIRQLRRIKARCSSLRASARRLYRPYFTEVKKLHLKPERLPRFVRLLNLPLIPKYRKRRPAHRKPVFRIKTPWKVYVRKARQCARNYDQKRRLFVTLRNRIEKSKGKPSKKTMAQGKKLITKLRRIRRRCRSLRATARRLYKPYLSQVRKHHMKAERLSRFSALQKLPRLPKDKNGTPFKIFLCKDDVNLYNFHKNWYWYYETRYRQLWPGFEVNRQALKNYRIEYARSAYLARTVKGGWITQARNLLNQIKNLARVHNSGVKTIANMLKQKNYHLKMMKHYWPNPEVPYVKALGLYYESEMRLYYKLVRYRDSYKGFLQWQNTVSTNRNPAYLQEMRNWQHEASVYARKSQREIAIKRHNKALMRRLFTKISKPLQYRYRYQSIVRDSQSIRIYYPRISENVRDLINIRIAYARSHNRNLYYRRLIQFYERSTNSLQTELNIAYADERLDQRTLNTHFRYLNNWTKFYYSWGIYENYEGLEEWHERLAVFAQNRYQHFLRLVRVYPRNPATSIWRAWAEYFRRQYVWRDQRLATITARTNQAKALMIRDFRKQSNYNKIYFGKYILTRLKWGFQLNSGLLAYHRRALAARRALYTVTTGQLKVNQHEFMTYDERAMDYHAARLNYLRGQYKMFGNLYKNKKIRLNIANLGQMLNRKYFFAKDSITKVYQTYQNLATTLLRQGRTYQAQRKKSSCSEMGEGLPCSGDSVPGLGYSSQEGCSEEGCS